MFINNDLLKKIHTRAHQYDFDNKYPIDDLNDLKAIGYLKAFVPKGFKGFDLSIKNMIDEQINLSYHAPATALCLNMHQIIVGLGKTLLKTSPAKGGIILEKASQNKLLSFGISEAANDKVLFGSLSRATKLENGDYLISGKKIFITNASHFDYLLTYAHDHENNQSVFGLIGKESKGIQIVNDWDALGMRATDSSSILLSDVLLTSDHVIATIKPGPSKEPIIKGIFAHFELFLAATYHGIGKRALDIGVEHVKKRISVSNENTYANDKDIRWRISEAAILLDGIKRDIDSIADIFDNEIEDPHLFLKLSTIKNKAVETSKKALDEIIRACGGSSYLNQNELSRLYRDVLAGIFQPSDQESLHNSWANALLGPIE